MKKPLVDKKYLLPIPFCALLLLGMNIESYRGAYVNENAIGTIPINHLNDIDYISVSALKQNTDTYFYYCFSTEKKNLIEVKLFYVDTLTGNETLIHQNRVLKDDYLRGSCSTLETNNIRFYSHNSSKGPRYRMEFRYGKSNLKEYILEPKFASKSYTFTGDDEVSSEENILFVTKDESKFVSESFKFPFLSNEIDLTGDNSLDLDFTFLEVTKKALEGVSIPVSDGAMSLIDFHDLFIDDIKENGFVRFSGYFNITSRNLIKFTSTPKYYIDPLTRVLYLDNAPGRILTKKLYFPLGAYHAIENSEHSDINPYLVVGATVGFSKFEVGAIFDINLSPDNVVGACYNSGFCITSIESESEL